MSAEKLEELRFNVARSLRYHDKRRAFFELLGKTLQFSALVGSSAAVLALVRESGSDWLAVVFAAIAAVASLLNLVIGTSTKYETYTKLKNRFIDLQARIDEIQEPTEEEVAKVMKERHVIEKEEPSISIWLNKVCYNETVDALGYDVSAKRPIHWWYHLGNLKLA